ncbi:PREDICTED: E3 ubiquitin-protein ligase XB3-like [Nelumbo nucifera]|uniref:E3 ubiquitin-protein ligase XB3-like n=1 Tax=Nelumbo nucifera TaxID=4432 RepID=A0A1U8Q4Y2_NELNU|nr:PREDICTED: E3 ubiquitin-protein ligase XB3-like [Nelumbo nucifera]
MYRAVSQSSTMTQFPLGRTCLYHATYYGHSVCLQAILVAAQSIDVADSLRLHLVARGGSLDCLRELLSWGAISFKEILLDKSVCNSWKRYSE